MIVRVPASSANLGPGFDALGMALSIYAELIVGDVDDADLAGAQLVDEHHPASIAFRRGGGEGELRVRSSIPVGRGLGFSGAMRVGGAVAAHGQRHGNDQERFRVALPDLLQLASDLEGHADNAAASLYGGVVATAAGRAIAIPLGFEPTMVLWVPASATATDESRRQLPEVVSLADAAHNIGRTALLIAALVAGDGAALRAATEDRLHQDVRLRHAPSSRLALDAALAAGALAAWLSGSGPSVAAMCPAADAAAIAAALPTEGRCLTLAVDHAGAVMLPD